MLYAYAFLKTQCELCFKKSISNKKGGKMNVFLYIIIFIMGTVFGSFYTLAVYRIPRKIDIVHTHSFCPNCKHKLGFWELIPVWSYIALAGRCKSCKQKIRPRYLIIEVLSGLTFVLVALALKIDAYNINLNSIIYFAFLVLYLTAIFIISGIDKESRHIEKGVMYYALIISIIYIIYSCIIDKTAIGLYVIHLTAMLILLIIDTLILRKNAKNNYVIQILMLIIVMAIFTTEITTIFTIIVTLLAIALSIIVQKIENRINKNRKKEEKISENLPIGFFLCFSNVLMLIAIMFMSVR